MKNIKTFFNELTKRMINLISAIIMASGFAKRMGQNKLLMKYNNKFLIEYTLNIISECNFKQKILVTQYDEIKEFGEKLNYKVVSNIFPNKGQSESIKLGVKNCDCCQGYMFFVGDQPLINKKDIEKLIKVFKEDTDCIVIPKYRDSSGNPVIYPSTYKEKLLNLKGDKGGKSVIKSSHKIKYVNVSKNTLFDIDNIDDFNNLLRRGAENEKGHNSN
ncbi:molybdenum cofactor cytidylyltransferase [Terrisporobacter petrolearius]|uniref:molybdenum cofactor cytidylyltransferase n=1 Tax=Terrisporobacter petrolearius TaxID=1460447 RepID=UPI0031CCBC1C